MVPRVFVGVDIDKASHHAVGVDEGGETVPIGPSSANNALASADPTSVEMTDRTTSSG